MHISEVRRMQEEKDHQMRHGHMSHEDRESIAMHRYPDKMAQGYHSPDVINVDAHGAELQ